MEAAIDHHFVQNTTKFDMEMMESYRLVLQHRYMLLNAVRYGGS